MKTESKVMKKEWEKEFIEKFEDRLISGMRFTPQNCGILIDILNFISELLDQAIQSERSKMLDDLKSLRTDIHSYLIFEVAEDIAYKVGDMLGDFILSHDKAEISNEINGGRDEPRSHK